MLSVASVAKGLRGLQQRHHRGRDGERLPGLRIGGLSRQPGPRARRGKRSRRLPVAVSVPALGPEVIDAALDAGLLVARALRARGVIKGAALTVQGCWGVLGTPGSPGTGGFRRPRRPGASARHRSVSGPVTGADVGGTIAAPAHPPAEICTHPLGTPFLYDANDGRMRGERGSGIERSPARTAGYWQVNGRMLRSGLMSPSSVLPSSEPPRESRARIRPSFPTITMVDERVHNTGDTNAISKR